MIARCRPLHLALALLLAGSCTWPAAVMAQAADSARVEALEQQLQRGLALIEKLSARVAELEREAKVMRGAAAAPAAAEPSAMATAPAVAALAASVDSMASGLSRRDAESTMGLRGFLDTGAAWSTRADPNRLRGFNSGTLDLYMTPRFSDRTKALVELVVEYHDTGEVALDLERAQIGHTFSDALTLWLGRYHTPLGHWNTAYHHGQQLQSSITRPRFIDFEDRGGLIGAHSVGLWANGQFSRSGYKLGYDLYLSNGNTIQGRVLDFHPFSDSDSSMNLGFNLRLQPQGAWSGLTVGAHGVTGSVKVNDETGAALGRSRLRMLGAYTTYEAGDWDIAAEAYRFGNRVDGQAGKQGSTLWYLQLGHEFGDWQPFVRLESASLSQADPYFTAQASGRSYRRSVVGVRYALAPRSAFKFELGHTREAAAVLWDANGQGLALPAVDYRRVAVQLSTAF